MAARPGSCPVSVTTRCSASRSTWWREPLAMRRFGVPSQILTDNGKVFTGRFGPGTGEVLNIDVRRVAVRATLRPAKRTAHLVSWSRQLTRGVRRATT